MKLKKTEHFLRRTLVLVLALPLSAFAESRPRGGTDLERLAADLERVLGRGSVSVGRAGDTAPREPRPTVGDERAAGATTAFSSSD